MYYFFLHPQENNFGRCNIDINEENFVTLWNVVVGDMARVEIWKFKNHSLPVAYDRFLSWCRFFDRVHRYNLDMNKTGCWGSVWIMVTNFLVHWRKPNITWKPNRKQKVKIIIGFSIWRIVRHTYVRSSTRIFGKLMFPRTHYAKTRSLATALWWHQTWTINKCRDNSLNDPCIVLASIENT